MIRHRTYWRMSNAKLRALLVAGAIVLINVVNPAAAGAEDAAKSNDTKADAAKNEEFIKRLFAGPVGKNKSYACFIRQYDADHLARHPLQKVSAMKLLVTAETVPESEGPRMSTPFSSSTNAAA